MYIVKRLPCPQDLGQKQKMVMVEMNATTNLEQNRLYQTTNVYRRDIGEFDHWIETFLNDANHTLEEMVGPPGIRQIDPNQSVQYVGICKNAQQAFKYLSEHCDIHNTVFNIPSTREGIEFSTPLPTINFSQTIRRCEIELSLNFRRGWILS